MNQVDKERLAVAAALSLFLYAGLFALTAWLDVLKPSPLQEYIGPITVQVTLAPEPRKILPPDPPEPVPEPKPEPKPVPEPKPQPEVSAQPEPKADSSPPASRSSAGNTETRQASQAADASQATPAREPIIRGTSETSSRPAAEIAAEAFQALRPKVVTDQFGADEVEYGDEDPDPTDSEVGDSTGDSTESEFVDLTGLDNITTTTGNGGTSTGTGTGNSENGSESGDIVAESIDELIAHRRVLDREDPDMEGITLPNNLPSMEVWVEFTIQRSGLVSRAIVLDDTGDATLTTRIETALRRWKFAPIAADRQVKARLKYVIQAVQESQ